MTGKAKSFGINTAVDPRSLLIVAIVAIVGGLLWCAVIIATALAARGHRLTGVQRGLGVVLVAALCLTVAMPSAMAARYSLIQRDLIDTRLRRLRASSRSRASSQPKAAGRRPVGEHRAGQHAADRLGLRAAQRPDRRAHRLDRSSRASTPRPATPCCSACPRNLENVPFPASDPLSKVWPNGFNCGGVCLLNAVWQQGEAHKNLFPNGGKDAGIIATRDAVGAVLGIKLDYYTVIDLTGFQGLVNAMGGVYVNVNEKLPIGGSHDGDGRVLTSPTGYILPGKHKKLTGYYALWFARSRFSTDDYDRMRRQRCLISDIVSQSNPVKMLQKYPQIAAVAKSNIATNIPRQDLPAWVDADRADAGRQASPACPSPPRW